MSEIHVLCVDEDSNFTQIISEFLEDENPDLEVTCFSDPFHGLEFVEKNSIDCVVSDYDMPGMDGLKFLEKAREHDPKLPFILFTGKGDEDVASEAVSAGVTDYIQKSTGVDQYKILANRIENAVEKYRAEKALRESEEKYRTLVEQSHDGIYIYRGKEILFVNERICELLGYTEDEMYNMDDPFKVVHPDDRDRVKRIAREREEGGDAPSRYETKIVNKDGEVRHWEVSVEETLYEGEEAALTSVRDITERKRMEDEREALLERINDAFISLDENMCLTYLNRRAEEILGRTRENLVGESLWNFFDSEKFRMELNRAINEQEEVSFDEYHEDFDTWFETRAYPSQNGITVYLHDISDRKRRDKALEILHQSTRDLIQTESREEVGRITAEAARNLLDFSVAEVFVMDDDGSLSSLATDSEPEFLSKRSGDGALDAFENREGPVWEVFEKNEIKSYSDLSDTDDKLYTQSEIRGALIAPIADHGVLVIGSSDVVEFEGYDLETIRILVADAAVAVDGIEREELLVEERDRFASLFENIPDPATAVTYEDGETVIQDINPAFEEVFGYSAEEAIGESLDELIVPEEKQDEAENINEEIQDGKALRAEIRREAKDGIHDFLLHAIPPKPGQTQSYGIYTDITNRKKRERRLEVLNRVLRHDIRNYINVVIGNADILDEEVDPSLEPMVKKIKDNASEISEISDKARYIEKTIRSDKIETRSINIVNVIEKTLKTFGELHPEADLRYEGPKEEWVQASELIEFAVENVVENSIEHNDKDVPEITVALDKDTHSEFVEISVKDNGPGIPEEEIDVLEKGRETDLQHISGIGLWLINWAVDESGGEITFEKNQPEGSVVSIRLKKVEKKEEIDKRTD